MAHHSGRLSFPASTVPGKRQEVESAYRRFGFVSAVDVVVLTAAYFIPLAMGFVTLPSPDVPFIDPWYWMMEVLIILLAPFMVALAVAVHSWASPRYRPYTLASVVFMAIAAGITTCVHVVVLTLARRPDFKSLPWLSSMVSFQWPSVTYTLDVVAWDVFFPLSVLCLVPVFSGRGRARALRVLLLVSGGLAIAGLAGIVVDDMNIRNVGIVGYAVVYPVAALLLARMFRRSP